MNAISFTKRALQGGSGGAVQVADDQPLPVQAVADSAALTKSVVTMDGSSKALVAADATRLSIEIMTAASNVAAVGIDKTGGTAVLDEGVQLLPGGYAVITGRQAQAAMTVIGSSGDKVTVYEGH